MKGCWFVLLMLAACHDVVAPKSCLAVTKRDLHVDSTWTTCKY